MPRISNSEKLKYQPLNEVGKDTPCFYCESPSAMMDLSPNPNAAEIDKNLYPDPWTRAMVCRKCWMAIYAANIIQGGQKFGVNRGCMTVAHKQALIGGIRPGQSQIVSNDFMINFDRTRALPSSIMRLEDGQYVMDGRAFTADEIMALQGPILSQMMRLPKEVTMKAFAGAMATGDLEPGREMDYLKLLGIEVSVW